MLSDELDFLFILNMDENIIEGNRAINSILGYSTGELSVKNLLAVYPLQDKEKASVMIPMALKGNIVSSPYPLATKSNEIIPVDTKFYVGWWHEENVIAAISTNLSAAYFSKELFFNIFNGSKVMMSISTFDPSIIFNVNQTFIETLEYSLEEISGKSVHELGIFYYNTEHEKILNQYKEKGRAEGEITLKTKSGKLIVCLFSLEEIKVRENRYLLSAAIDITQRKLMEEKLEYLNRQQKLLADVA